MKYEPPILKRFKALAFSLPEVAIAVAIASLALISIMGLLPSGLESVRRSAEVTGVARIVRQVVAEIQMGDWGQPTGSTSWSNLAKLLKINPKGNWYFDDQANPIDKDDPSFEQRLSYVVRAHGVAAAGDPAPAVVPGGNNALNSAYAIQIDVAPTTDKDFDFADAKRYQTQTAIIARQLYTP